MAIFNSYFDITRVSFFFGPVESQGRNWFENSGVQFYWISECMAMIRGIIPLIVGDYTMRGNMRACANIKTKKKLIN